MTRWRWSFLRRCSRARISRCVLRYAGSVLSDAGGGLLYVGARGTWYPNRGIAMANYDLSFRFPRPWSLIATGKRVSLERDGNDFVGHWVSEQPIPIAGFNLGEYVRSSAKSGRHCGGRLRCARDGIPARGAGRRKTGPSQLQSPHAPGTLEPVPDPPPLPDPASTGEMLANHAAETLTGLSQMLGPYPFSSAFADGKSRMRPARDGRDSSSFPAMRTCRSEQLDAIKIVGGGPSHLQRSHDAARTDASVVRRRSIVGQLSRAVAAGGAGELLLHCCCWSASRPADVQFLLEGYRQILGKESKDGRRQVEAGPVTLGARLSSSMFPNGYEIIAYGRGTWLMHMLREMLRDASRTAENPAGDDTRFFSRCCAAWSIAIRGRRSPMPISSRPSKRCCRARCGLRIASRWTGSSTAG